MECTQPTQHNLGDALALGTVEKDVEDEGLVDRLLCHGVDVGRREDAGPQRAVGFASRLDATVDVDRIVAKARQEAAEILEDGDDGHEAPAWQQHVREVGAVDWGI